MKYEDLFGVINHGLKQNKKRNLLSTGIDFHRNSFRFTPSTPKMDSRYRDDDGPSRKRRKIESDEEKNYFSLYPRDKFDKKFPKYRQPQEIGCFSLDIKRQILHDKSRLRYYYPSCPHQKDINSDDVCFDLRLGFDKMIQKSDEKEYIDDMLRWILKHRNVFELPSSKSTTTSTTTTTQNTKIEKDSSSTSSTKNTDNNDHQPESDKKEKLQTPEKSSCLNTDFVSWRGVLTRLLCSPYENREGWMLAITRFNDTFYICEFETEEKKRMEENQSKFQKEMCYWGWKFEQYLTTDTPDGKPDTSSPVNNCEAYCTVIRTRLNTHSLFFSGEVDCIDSDGKYIELKTSRELFNSNQKDKFKRFKLIKWWAQSFLPGVPKIIGGFRNDDGVVNRLEEFDTFKIPDMVKDINNPWSPNVCFNFLDEFLTHIKDTVKINDHRNVYLFSRAARSNYITWQNLGPDSEFQFLPKWYIDEFK